MAIIIGVIICIFMAAGASRLGYSGIIWFFASVAGGPAFNLGLITAMPDRRLERRRVSELAVLRLELAEVVAKSLPDPAVPQQTIGDLATQRE